MKPRPVPRLICETREEKITFLEGRLRRELRGRQREEREMIAANFYKASDADLNRLMEMDSLI
jgi:hypothetical protein